MLNGLNNSVLNVKALVGSFNQEKALVGAFSVIVKTDAAAVCSVVTLEVWRCYCDPHCGRGRAATPLLSILGTLSPVQRGRGCTPQSLDMDTAAAALSTTRDNMSAS